MNLIEFLAKAKSKTFASPFSVPKGILTGNKRYEYSEGGFNYVDSYTGSIRDHSTEIIKFEGREIWRMDSQGGMVSVEGCEARECFAFLKKCLRNAPTDFPIRGPEEFIEGSWSYLNKWKGDLERFSGDEKVLRQNKEVYSRTYQGGIG